MEAIINEIATSAGRVILNPFLLGLAVIGLLALVTGTAARVAMAVEELPARCPRDS